MTKVNIKEIDDYFQDFETEAKNWKTQFDGITKSVDGIIGMDSLKGPLLRKQRIILKMRIKWLFKVFHQLLTPLPKMRLHC